ncbi:peroxisome biogenesis protein 16 [Phtheirospermum japonicum]|uniref:Peroxisomal membrane protein PEX16 n=1 Tax=Phtheirospermum japonicum TaxID=374723 RepID=A0A830CJU6_9LAMI|nr:peroxisome biogenesis protein 16 [Phtheirospermum japonicum]
MKGTHLMILIPVEMGLLLEPGPHGVMKNHYGPTSWNLEGRALSALSRFGENARAVSEPTWFASSSAPTGDHGASKKFGTRSWFPWLTSLVVDLIGHGIVSSLTIWRRNSKDFHLSNLEKNELKRRKLLWALYLMRDPFFSKYTRQRLDSAEKLLQPIPIIGLLAEKLVELLEGAQTRYTYMSGS